MNPRQLRSALPHEDDETLRAYLDVSCAACHTGELRYNGQAIRIDAGSAIHPLTSSVPTCKEADLLADRAGNRISGWLAGYLVTTRHSFCEWGVRLISETATRVGL